MNNEQAKKINEKILKGEALDLTEEQKKQAIEKEEFYRNLYHQYFDLDWTNDYLGLCKKLIDGYQKLNDAYQNDSQKSKDDIDYVIKFAFRDFYLLIFINDNEIFTNSDFLKELHKKVYFSDTFVTVKEFDELIKYCEEYIKTNDQQK